MVAMGTSFADQAWGRESAVYRVAGVINVIGSWLLTALVAFSSSAIMATILYFAGIPGFFALAALAAFLLIRSHLVFRKKSKEDASTNQFLSAEIVDIHEAIEESKNGTIRNLKTVRNATVHILQALSTEKKELLEKPNSDIKKLREQNDKLHGKIVKHIRKLEKGRLAAGRLYLLVFDLMQDLYQSSDLISHACTNHIHNHHPLPKKEFLSSLSVIEKELGDYADSVMEQIAMLDFKNAHQSEEKKIKIQATINEVLDTQIVAIQKGDLGSRMGLLQTRLLIELRDIVIAIHNIGGLYQEYSKPVPQRVITKETTTTA
jgi:hypothetical protein